MGSANGSAGHSRILNREASLLDHLGGAARREQTDILLDEALGEVEQAGLVVDRQDGDLLVGFGGHDCGYVQCLFLRMGRKGDKNSIQPGARSSSHSKYLHGDMASYCRSRKFDQQPHVRPSNEGDVTLERRRHWSVAGEVVIGY